MKDLLEAFEGTLAGERINSLLSQYERLGLVQSRFQKDFSVSCISGCGKCCEHYVPFLSESEALVAAYVIIRDKREEEVLARLNGGSPSSPVCPLYNKDGEYHCALYEGRSLVCRLFGLSVSQDKEGRPVWKACKWKEGKGEVISTETLQDKRESVPVMAEYGEKLTEYGDTEGDSIYDALPKAIWKLKMLLSLTDSNPA